MLGQPNQFTDADAYERGMGVWSRLAGDVFLDWLAPADGLKWVDVGCGNGAFTALIVDRCAPTQVVGVDPSAEQISYARERIAASEVEFLEGDALALPFGDNVFDAAIMALVIFFVPDPTKGLGEMLRVVRPGGTVAAYAWDLLRGGFPFEAIWDEMRTLGISPKLPPSPDISCMENMRALWSNAGLDAIATKEIVVKRTFNDFDEFWTISTGGTMGKRLAAEPDAKVDTLRNRVRARLPTDAAGRITFSARANAAIGRVP